MDCSIRTVDTDVLALHVGKLRNLFQIHNVNIWVAFGTGKFFKDCETTINVNIWVAFGTGKFFKDISVNSIFAGIGADKAESILAFHAFTGCDCVSAFYGRGKKTAWNVWLQYPEVTEAFLQITRMPFREVDELSRIF